MGNRGWDAIIYLCSEVRGDEWCESIRYTHTRLSIPSVDNLAETTLAKVKLEKATQSKANWRTPIPKARLTKNK
jgi:hypothetical protein